MGKVIHILGSGPSLASWHGGCDYAIAVNDTWHKVDARLLPLVRYTAIVDGIASIRNNRPMSLQFTRVAYCVNDKTAKACKHGVHVKSTHLAHALGRNECNPKVQCYHQNNGAVFAIMLALHLELSEGNEAPSITLYGVDIIGHYELGNTPERAEQQVKALKLARSVVEKRGGSVQICEQSKLYEIWQKTA